MCLGLQTSLIFFFSLSLCAAIRFDEIRVFGYTAWSLLDGFEWQDGYTTRRGLFYVDFNSKQKERKPKSSAHYYKQIIRENGFPLKESPSDVRGEFPCDFSWGVTESVLKVSGYLTVRRDNSVQNCIALTQWQLRESRQTISNATITGRF